MADVSWQCSRDIWVTLSLTCFNFCLALKRSGSWTWWSLKIPSSWSALFCSVLCYAMLCYAMLWTPCRNQSQLWRDKMRNTTQQLTCWSPARAVLCAHNRWTLSKHSVFHKALQISKELTELHRKSCQLWPRVLSSGYCWLWATGGIFSAPVLSWGQSNEQDSKDMWMTHLQRCGPQSASFHALRAGPNPQCWIKHHAVSRSTLHPS